MMKSQRQGAFVTFALITVSIFGAGPGHGSQPDVLEASLSVSLADLNLSSDEGVEVLYRRLQHAAEQVCGPQNLRDAGSLVTLKTNKQCFDTSLGRAVAAIGHQALTELHEA